MLFYLDPRPLHPLHFSKSYPIKFTRIWRDFCFPRPCSLLGGPLFFLTPKATPIAFFFFRTLLSLSVLTATSITRYNLFSCHSSFFPLIQYRRKKVRNFGGRMQGWLDHVHKFLIGLKSVHLHVNGAQGPDIKSRAIDNPPDALDSCKSWD